MCERRKYAFRIILNHASTDLLYIITLRLPPIYSNELEQRDKTMTQVKLIPPVNQFYEYSLGKQHIHQTLINGET